MLPFQEIKAWILDRPFKIDQLVIEKFKVDRILGAGSYGIAYLVTDITNQKQVVLKQLRPSRRKTFQGTNSFAKETEILKYLDHCSIPKVIEKYESEKLIFFTMDYKDGKTYEDIIFGDGEQFSEQESFQIIKELLEIVIYLHGKNIVHRDIRIPNVIRKDGKLSLIDFGLARFLHDLHDRSHQTDFRRQDPPEKRLKRELHVRSDFYALGHFALFLLYSNYQPSEKKEKSWEEELQISNAAKRVIRKMLQIDKPYEYAKELYQEITKLC